MGTNFLEIAFAFGQPEQHFADEDHCRHPEVPDHLSFQQVELVRRRRWPLHLRIHVCRLTAAALLVLWIACIMVIVPGELQESLHSARDVFRPGMIESMWQQ